ncbi:TetR family transcriptional regulator [Actinomycetaceae bacterium MB13-C1-2]|nr:TetR family transcriptional regulator [Actinomycetaceae bacterium MB13-C1-2]
MATNVRGEQRRELLLNAAVRVVAGGGAGALTHRAVASTAGVSHASVTYHYPSIADLRRATLTFAANKVGPEFAASLSCNEGGTAVLEDLVSRWRQIGLNHREEFVTLFALLIEALYDEDLRADVDGLFAQPTQALVDEGVPLPAAETIIGSLIGSALIALARSEPDEALGRFDAGVVTLLDAMRNGLSHE